MTPSGFVSHLETSIGPPLVVQYRKLYRNQGTKKHRDQNE